MLSALPPPAGGELPRNIINVQLKIYNVQFNIQNKFKVLRQTKVCSTDPCELIVSGGGKSKKIIVKRQVPKTTKLYVWRPAPFFLYSLSKPIKAPKNTDKSSWLIISISIIKFHLIPGTH